MQAIAGQSGRDHWMARVVAGVCFVLALVVLIFPLQDYDTFWHLAYGRAMVEQGRFINQEIFSYTAPGVWLGSHSQLAQVLLFLVWRAGGAVGLLLMKLSLAAVVFWLLVRTARFLGTSLFLAAPLALLAMTVGLGRFVERPELFSIVLFALLAWLLFGCRCSSLSLRLLWLLPGIMVLWDYLHGALYGLLFLLAFVCAESLYGCWPRIAGFWRDDVRGVPREWLRALWLVTGVTVAAMLLNPNGLRAYEGFWRVSSHAGDFAMFGEWRRPDFSGQFFWFWLLLFLVLALSLRYLRRIDLTALTTLAPFAILALRYNRGVLVFALASVPLCAQALTLLGGELAVRCGRRRAALLRWSVLVILLTGVLIYKSCGVISNFRLATGVDETVFPVGSTRFVQAVGLEGNLYNMDGYGGYLAYHLGPQRKIFHYNQPVVFTALTDFVHKPKTRAKWQIRYAIIGKAEELRMFERDGYVPVYWEPSGMVLLKPDSGNQALIERYRITRFQPLLSDDEYRRRAIVPALALRLGGETADYLTFRRDERFAGLLAELTARADLPADLATRRRWLEQALPYNGESLPLLMLLGDLASRMNDVPAAERAYRQVLAVDAAAEAVRLKLGYLLYDRRDYGGARAQFAALVAAHTENLAALYALALTDYRSGAIAPARDGFERFLQLAPNDPYATKARAFLAAMPQKEPSR